MDVARFDRSFSAQGSLALGVDCVPSQLEPHELRRHLRYKNRLDVEAKKNDTTRASRAGHEFHEAWTARKPLQLFRLDSDLVGISIEGLSPEDQGRASKAAVEIADIALYFGNVANFERGARKTIAQFKYSERAYPFHVSTLRSVEQGRDMAIRIAKCLAGIRRLLSR
jgi:hypothetical protein